MKKIILFLFMASICFAGGNVEIDDGVLKVMSPDSSSVFQFHRDNTNVFMDWTTGTLFMTGGPINWGGLDFLNVGNITGSDIDISAGTGDYTSSGDVTLSGSGTVQAVTITDGTTTITGGNYTGVGNITGTDVDISAGTGDITTSGIGTFGQLINTGGRIVNTTRITGNTTLDATHHVVFCDTDGGSFVVTLPAGVDGTQYKIINTGSNGNTVTVTPDGSENLLGLNSSVLLRARNGTRSGDKLVIEFETTEHWY